MAEALNSAFDYMDGIAGPDVFGRESLALASVTGAMRLGARCMAGSSG